MARSTAEKTTGVESIDPEAAAVVGVMAATAGPDGTASTRMSSPTVSSAARTTQRRGTQARTTETGGAPVRSAAGPPTRAGGTPRARARLAPHSPEVTRSAGDANRRPAATSPATIQKRANGAS